MTTTVASLPSELQLCIFDALCEQEFVDYPRRASLKKSVQTRSRSLKTPILSVSQVCKAWRELTLSTPCFWVSTFSLYRYSQYQSRARIQEIDSVLSQSEGSDVDLFFSFDSHPFDGAKWFEDFILPVKHRIRIFEAFSLPTEAIICITNLLSYGYWHRLRALLLDAKGSYSAPPTLIRAPYLQCFQSRWIFWCDGIPIRDLSTLKLLQWASEDEQFWSISTLNTFLKPSAHTLTTLIVDLTNSPSPQVLDHPKERIYLPFLAKLSLRTTFMKSLILFVTSVQAPSLLELDAETLQFSELKLTLTSDISSVKRLSLTLPAKCFPPLFQVLSFKNVEHLVLQAAHHNPTHSLVKPNGLHQSPIHFQRLKNLRVTWYQVGENYEQCSWFFSYFNFTSTSKHVSLSLGCNSIDDLQQVILPSLKHLCLTNLRPSSVEQSGHKISKCIHVHFEQIQTLEVDGWIISQEIDASDFARHFEGVTRLVIKALICPPFKQSLAFNLWNQVEEGKPFFPKLQTLDVIFGDDLIESFFVPLGSLNAIKKIISLRNDIGWPISTVRFEKPPPTGMNDLDIEWFKANVEKVGWFQVSDDFSWYSDYYPFER